VIYARTRRIYREKEVLSPAGNQIHISHSHIYALHKSTTHKTLSSSARFVFSIISCSLMEIMRKLRRKKNIVGTPVGGS